MDIYIYYLNMYIDNFFIGAGDINASGLLTANEVRVERAIFIRIYSLIYEWNT